MRLFASLAALLTVTVLVPLMAWPAISHQSFPLPGYRQAVPDAALTGLAVVAAALATWVLAFWDLAHKHRLIVALMRSR